MNVFGVRGIVLEVRVTSRLLDCLWECTCKSVETIQRLASEDNIKKLHEVKRFDIKALMENVEGSRKKVVPEVMHILRDFKFE